MEKVKFLKLREASATFRQKLQICNILPRQAVSNGFVVIKLKLDLKIQGSYILTQLVHTLYTRRLLI